MGDRVDRVCRRWAAVAVSVELDSEGLRDVVLLHHHDEDLVDVEEAGVAA